MSAILTSWKEIAAYLRKGVRTVQRWERDFGLPVRRPKAGGLGIVLAVPEELDAWLHSQPQHDSGEGNSHLKQLTSTVVKLQDENAMLRQQLRRLTNESPQSDGETVATQAVDTLLQQCSQLVSTSSDSFLDCAESIEMARNIRMLHSLQHHSAGSRPLFQQQFSVMLTCCAMAEDDLVYGRIEQARKLIQKLRLICESIQSRLDAARLPDSRMDPVKEQLTALQARMLSIESRFIT